MFHAPPGKAKVLPPTQGAAPASQEALEEQILSASHSKLVKFLSWLNSAKTLVPRALKLPECVFLVARAKLGGKGRKKIVSILLNDTQLPQVKRHFSQQLLWNRQIGS
jgi:hypothetical protein